MRGESRSRGGRGKYVLEKFLNVYSPGDLQKFEKKRRRDMGTEKGRNRESKQSCKHFVSVVTLPLGKICKKEIVSGEEGKGKRKRK